MERNNPRFSKSGKSQEPLQEVLKQIYTSQTAHYYGLAIERTYLSLPSEKREGFTKQLESLLEKYLPCESKSQGQDLQALLNEPITALNLPPRAINALTYYNVVRIEELVTKTEAEVKHYRNIGPRTLEQIKEALKK